MKDKNKIKPKIELRNEEIDAILGHVPGRVARNGIMVIFTIILLLLTGSYFFSYPDTVDCRILITSTEPPVHFVAKESGKIKLFVSEKQKVTKGELLAMYDNFADTTDSIINSRKISNAFYSPCDGIVSLSKTKILHTVMAGELIISVLSLHAGKLVGIMEIPVSCYGKIKQGLKVNVKLDSYPYMEYGIVRGILTFVSSIPSNNVYYAGIEFPNGLRSNYGNTIPFNYEMSGTASIIVDDLSLFQRFLQPVRYAISKNNN
jgi:HlyD family secretion protein